MSPDCLLGVVPQPTDSRLSETSSCAESGTVTQFKAMLPYSYAAGHHNYARYLSWYVRQMEHLPRRAKEDLLAGAHVCRHSDGGTAMPADQFGEQTYQAKEGLEV